MAIVLLAGCGGGSQSGGTGAQLVVARVKDAVVLDPSHATDGLSLTISQEILSNLVRFKPGSFDLEPDIATAWKASPDAKTWTFTLRPGMKFSDGTPVDAAAVKFNFDRWRDTKDPDRGNFPYGYYASMFGGFDKASRCAERDHRRRPSEESVHAATARSRDAVVRDRVSDRDQSERSGFRADAHR
jgi:peptide/nickel transport system substrate-binding protein